MSTWDIVTLLWRTSFLVSIENHQRSHCYRGGSRTAATSKIENFVKPFTIITKCSILGIAVVLDAPLVSLCKMWISLRPYAFIQKCYYLDTIFLEKIHHISTNFYEKLLRYVKLQRRVFWGLWNCFVKLIFHIFWKLRQLERYYFGRSIHYLLLSISILI